MHDGGTTAGSTASAASTAASAALCPRGAPYSPTDSLLYLRRRCHRSTVPTPHRSDRGAVPTGRMLELHAVRGPRVGSCLIQDPRQDHESARDQRRFEGSGKLAGGRRHAGPGHAGFAWLGLFWIGCRILQGHRPRRTAGRSHHPPKGECHEAPSTPAASAPTAACSTATAIPFTLAAAFMSALRTAMAAAAALNAAAPVPTAADATAADTATSFAAAAHTAAHVAAACRRSGSDGDKDDLRSGFGSIQTIRDQ